jgi:hypothetical protein
MAEEIAMSVTITGDPRRAIGVKSGPGVAGILLRVIRRRRAFMIGIALLFPILFNLLLLAILAVRFDSLPNYVLAEDWFTNVARIIVGTGSVSDMLPIIMDEWLLEIGYMNYTFGNGVSEWSLLVIPHKLLMTVLLGALIALNFVLAADEEPSGSLMRQSLRSARNGLLMSVGIALAGVSSISLFWVICHSGPSWVVSLAVLGVDAPTALRYASLGPALYSAGIAILLLSALLAVHDIRTAKEAGRC